MKIDFNNVPKNALLNAERPWDPHYSPLLQLALLLDTARVCHLPELRLIFRFVKTAELINVNVSDIVGLVWQERTEMIFRISWKHAANQCFNMQKDTNLFERWAIHTGKIITNQG